MIDVFVICAQIKQHENVYKLMNANMVIASCEYQPTANIVVNISQQHIAIQD